MNNKITSIEITLCESDLSDFLHGNESYIDAYMSELLKRMRQEYPGTSVTIGLSSNVLEDRVFVTTAPDFDPVLEDECSDTYHIVSIDMVNDLDDFLPEEA